MSAILVTGATGNVGREVVRALVARGVPVRAFVRDPERAHGLLGPSVELAVGDFSDSASLRRAMRGVGAVFLTSADGPDKVRHECAVVDAASAAWVERIVKLSSPHVEVGSDLAFWDWHARIEQHLRGSGVPSVVLRASYLMSNLLASAESVAATGELVAPAGDARIAIVDPADVGAVAAAVLTGAGEDGAVYRVTGPEPVTFDDVAAALTQATRRAVVFVDVSDNAARAGMLASGMPEWLAENLVTLFGKLQAGACTGVSAAVRDLTGREPRQLADWARDNATAFVRPSEVPVL